MPRWPTLDLPVHPPLPPMDAELASALPPGTRWQLEPKWDGFRCLAFRDGERVALQSKHLHPLGRFFPDVVEAVRSIAAERFVVDGEIVIPRGGRLSFDDLLLRMHPSAQRIAEQARDAPAALLVFDLLVDDDGEALLERPLVERRRRLEAFAARHLPTAGRVLLSPATTDRAVAGGWQAGGLPGLDGLVAKRLDEPYRSGERRGMVKVKPERTADVVVGGYRPDASGRGVSSLLLGLHDDDGLLHHVGTCSTLTGEARALLGRLLPSLVGPPGFTGTQPGRSRWGTRRSEAWVPVRPDLVAEVRYDHFANGRFRHGVHLVRWRPDKDPRACRLRDLEPPEAPAGR